jgi:hypothetical protein
MPEYAWPPALRPTRLSFYLQHNSLRFASPITHVTQVMRREGARWMAKASFDPLDRIRAGVLDGLLAALAGSVNTVRIWDWRREYRTGDPRSQSDVPTGPYSFSDSTIFTDALASSSARATRRWPPARRAAPSASRPRASGPAPSRSVLAIISASMVGSTWPPRR